MQTEAGEKRRTKCDRKNHLEFTLWSVGFEQESDLSRLLFWKDHSDSFVIDRLEGTSNGGRVTL